MNIKINYRSFVLCISIKLGSFSVIILFLKSIYHRNPELEEKTTLDIVKNKPKHLSSASIIAKGVIFLSNASVPESMRACISDCFTLLIFYFLSFTKLVSILLIYIYIYMQLLQSIDPFRVFAKP